MPYTHEGYGLPESYPSEHRGGDRRALAAQCAGVFSVAHDGQHPARRQRRRAWALVPRAVRDTAPPRLLDWVPPRARALLSRDLRRRNDLDRALATARGLAADDPACARFQGVDRHGQLDRQVRANARKAAA